MWAQEQMAELMLSMLLGFSMSLFLCMSLAVLAPGDIELPWVQ
jgi:hypothetical protein